MNDLIRIKNWHSAALDGERYAEQGQGQMGEDKLAKNFGFKLAKNFRQFVLYQGGDLLPRLEGFHYVEYNYVENSSHYVKYNYVENSIHYVEFFRHIDSYKNVEIFRVIMSKVIMSNFVI